MVLEYLLRDQQVRLVLVILQLEEQNLVVLAKLDLVVVDTLAKLVGRGSIPQLVQMLEAADSDCEYLPG